MTGLNGERDGSPGRPGGGAGAPGAGVLDVDQRGKENAVRYECVRPSRFPSVDRPGELVLVDVGVVCERLPYFSASGNEYAMMATGGRRFVLCESLVDDFFEEVEE